MPSVMPKLRSRAPSQPGVYCRKRLDGMHRLPATLDLATRQIIGIGAVDAVHVHEVHVRQLAGLVNGAPRAGERGQRWRAAVRP